MRAGLNPDEVVELIEAIDAFVIELQNCNEGPEFVRQAIVDGLAAFRFQLDKIGWMGAGYALAAFNELLAIHRMVEREYTPADPNAEAAVKGLFAIITKFKETVDTVSGWHEAGKAVHGAYALASQIAAPLLLLGPTIHSAGP